MQDYTKHICPTCGAVTAQESQTVTIHSPEPITTVNMTEVIKDASHKLDMLNLDIAAYRCEHGMGDKLIKIYSQMGHIDSLLRLIEAPAKGLEKQLGELNQPLADYYANGEKIPTELPF